MDRLLRDGVTLCYTDQGSGAPPLLFVHGWCCDHTYFQPQVEYFRRDHRCIAVDLRGHGESDKPVQAYTMALFADDLAWLCAQRGLRRPVVIGHSMGGVIALALAARYPQLPAAIAALDAPLLPPAALRQQRAPLLAALKTPAYRAAQQHFVGQRLFLPTDDAARKQHIVAQMAEAPQHVMQSAYEQLYAFDGEAALQTCTVPLLSVSAAQPLSDLARLQALCPQVVLGQTVGAGHFHQLEVPEQVNAMLARFLAVSVPAAPV